MLSLLQRLFDQLLDQAIFGNEWQSYVVGAFVVLVVFNACGDRMLIPRP
jgi:hypothetical protein